MPLDERSHSLLQPGFEASLWQVHEHGREIADRFSDIEDANDATFLQADDVDHQLGQHVPVEFEEQISGQRLDNVLDGPSCVADRRCARQIQYSGRTVAQHGDCEHALSVRAAPEKSDEPMLNHRPVSTGCNTNGDRGHPSRPMNCGQGRGARNHHRLVGRVPRLRRRPDGAGIE